jgi:hypothetical protein
VTISKINKPVPWHGAALTGDWIVSLKVDGVRAIFDDQRGWLSRADRLLYNIPPWQPGQARDCEVFVGTFQETIRATRTKYVKGDTPPIQPSHLYGLEPLDPRLYWGLLTNPTANDIVTHLKLANDHGYEGLVLRQDDRWLKVKPRQTYDVMITGFVEGCGKHLGRLGYVDTAMGKVGSGFSDKERRDLWAEAAAGRLIGQVIEVDCLQLTVRGQFRHPSFVRMRPDKLGS